MPLSFTPDLYSGTLHSGTQFGPHPPLLPTPDDYLLLPSQARYGRCKEGFGDGCLEVRESEGWSKEDSRG